MSQNHVFVIRTDRDAEAFDMLADGFLDETTVTLDKERRALELERRAKLDTRGSERPRNGKKKGKSVPTAYRIRSVEQDDEADDSDVINALAGKPRRWVIDETGINEV